MAIKNEGELQEVGKQSDESASVEWPTRNKKRKAPKNGRMFTFQTNMKKSGLGPSLDAMVRLINTTLHQNILHNKKNVELYKFQKYLPIVFV